MGPVALSAGLSAGSAPMTPQQVTVPIFLFADANSELDSSSRLQPRLRLHRKACVFLHPSPD
jgi:hypothetical protein